MTSQSPTKERLYRWFGVEGEDPIQFMRCMMLRNEFNHNICGITNPFLKIQRSSRTSQQQHDHDATGPYPYSVDNTNERQRLKSITQVDDYNDDDQGRNRWYERTVLAARTKTLSAAVALTGSVNMEKSWWPSLQVSQIDDEERDGIKETSTKWRIFSPKRNNRNSNGRSAKDGSFRKEDWRILTYRKRVGRGRGCYEKVRDAALDWEFQSADGSTGMMQVPDACPNSDNNYTLQSSSTTSANNKRSYSVQPIDDHGSGSSTTSSPNAYSPSSSLYRSLGSRRLVSFASKSITGFLPLSLQRRIYSINPVMVVYDVVDQRAPDGRTTFTSTAYATLKGHFLRGEERVTVALRDGSQDVEVEILSISRAGPSLFGKTLWPFISKMQSSFFRQQLQHLSESGLIEGDRNQNARINEGNLLH